VMLAHAQQSEFDTGPRIGGTERLCVVSRKVKPVADMIRFVVGPDGAAVPDLKGKLPGRGIWVTATQEAMKEAVRRGAFARAFRRAVKVSPDLVETTGRLLARSALDALAIAGKAAQVVTGFSNVEAALARDHVVAVLHASDAAADGVRKIAGALHRQLQADEQRIRVISAFTAAQLNLALGRPNVIHAALLTGPAAETFMARYARLQRFQSGDRQQWADRKPQKQRFEDED
jgi:uncharacterized protein